MTIILLICLIALAAAIQRMTLEHGLDRVTYDLQIKERVVECDQVFNVTTVLENRKWMPVLFMRLSEYYPKDIALDLDGTNVKQREVFGLNRGFVDVHQTMYMMPNQRLTRNLPAAFPTRGVKTFGSVTLTGGDLLGLQENEKKINFSHYMIVLPKRLPAPELMNTFGNFLGDMSVRRFILEDPVLTLSFREYTGREPMKDISWPRSMRDGKLMVKQYDYTMELSATVILNTRFEGDFNEEAFERALSITRGVCEQLEQKKIPYNFRTNVISSGISGSWTSTRDGMGRLHLMSILEGLGCASPHTSATFESLIESVAIKAEAARAHILVTVGMDGDRSATIRRAENIIGSKMFVIDTSEEVS